MAGGVSDDDSNRQTASKYIPKLERLGIPFYPFVRARGVDQNVARLRAELNSYRPFELIDAYLAETNSRA